MPGAAVAVVLAAAEPACLSVAASLFPEAECYVLSRRELRPRAPFHGPLFALLAAQPAGSCVGLVVPVLWRPAPATPTPALAAVDDHVNLELSSPLSGRWPSGLSRSFPPLAGIYQPAAVRARGGARVYSSGVVVAGVADAGRITPFESQAVLEASCVAVSDVLVPPVVVASYYDIKLAACGVTRVDDHD